MTPTSPGMLWSWSDVRSRAVALVVLGILAGLTIGLAIASFDGATRTNSALTRLRERTNASDAVVFPSQTGLVAADWTKLSQRPEVEHLVPWGLAFGNVAGTEGDLLFVPMDGQWLQQIDRPIVVAGRMFDPQAPDEVVVSSDAVTQLGFPVAVGGTFSFTPMTPDGDFSLPAAGPHLDLHIVGIVHTPLSYAFTGGAFLSPGFVRKYGDQALIIENSVIQLRDGAADIGALRRDVNTDVAEGVPVLDLNVTGRRVTATTDVEAAMLRLLAAIVALAGVGFVGQALARSAATIGADAPTLRALGMSRRELVVAALRPHLLTCATAAATTVLTVVVASRWFPVGLAAAVDPDRGVQVSAVLIVVSVLLAALVTLAVVTLAGWKAAGASSSADPRRGRLLARLHLARPVSVLIGARMALESGASTRRIGSAWPALIGAAAAVTGVVAIVTVNHGLTDALGHPEVAGVAWDASVMPAPDDVSITTGVKSSLVEAIAHQPGVAAVSSIGRHVSQIGDLGVPVFTVIDPPAGDTIRLVTLSGRGPSADDEIELGPSTARDLGVGIGDTVNLADGASARVVGLGLFPSDVHAQFDEGAWVSPQRWSALAALNYDPANGDELETVVAVRFTDRSHVAEQIGALSTAIGPTVQGVVPVDQPYELSNLHNVRTLPTVLATFLAILGAVAVGHALFSSVYRRRHDFAVLQSLGVTRAGVRGMIAAQATAVGIAGVIVGVPVGLIAGRAGWQAIADRVPITFRSPLTAVAVIVVVPVALAAANVLAIIPSRRASKTKPALVLRSE